MEREFCDHPITNADAREFNRLFYSGAQEVRLDKQGRIALPQNLIEWAGLKRDVVLAGVSNKIEVWDAQTWDTRLAKSLETFEATASKLRKPSGQ
jgi:MraZ protein